jgi:hypothetical protein
MFRQIAILFVWLLHLVKLGIVFFSFSSREEPYIGVAIDMSK